MIDWKDRFLTSGGAGVGVQVLAGTLYLTVDEDGNSGGQIVLDNDQVDRLVGMLLVGVSKKGSSA